jgi:hypothetical protein
MANRRWQTLDVPSGQHTRKACGNANLASGGVYESPQRHTDRVVRTANAERGEPAVSPSELADDLFHRIVSAVGPGHEISTLGIKRPNWISSFDRTGVWVETERSRARGSGPQLVPARMIEVAWDRLCKNGSLRQDELLNDLNVKRSAFVCALLAQFPDVVVRQTRPIVLDLIASSG